MKKYGEHIRVNGQGVLGVDESEQGFAHKTKKGAFERKITGGSHGIFGESG